MAYNKIKDDSKESRHSKIIFDELLNFIKNNNKEFNSHGEITNKALEYMLGKKMSNDIIEDMEIKFLIRKYQKQNNIILKGYDDIPEIKLD